MTAQNLTNFTKALKEVWEPDFAEFLNNSDRTRAQFEQSTRGVVQGKYIKAASHIGRNSGFAFLGEGEQTPTPGHQTFMNELITAKKAIGRIKLSSEVIEDSATNDAAIADAMTVEKEGLRRDARRELNFLLHAAGNGVIAQLKTTTTSTTVNLADATTQNVLRYLKDVISAGGSDSGLVIDIGTVAAPTTVAGGRTVQSINVSAKTIVISGATVTTTGSHFIFRTSQGGADGGIGQKVPSSLAQMISATAPLYGADPSTYPLWASQEVDADNAPANEDLFEDAFDLLDIATGEVYGDASALIVTTHQVRRELASSMKDRVRYQPLELRGGFKSNLTMEVGGGAVGLLVDRDCKDNTAYLTNPNDIKTVVASDWKFVEQAGSPVFYDKDDDSYHMLLRTRREYMIKDRRSSAVVTNIGAAEG